MLGIADESWTVEDLLTLGRLAAADVNWFYLYLIFNIQQEPAWPEFWERLKQNGRASLPSYPLRAPGVRGAPGSDITTRGRPSGPRVLGDDTSNSGGG